MVAFGQIFGFLCKKEGRNEQRPRHPWAVCVWGEYRNVPPTWIGTRNTTFTYGSCDRLNMVEFTTPYTGRDNIRTAYLRKFLVNKPRVRIFFFFF